MKEKHGKKGRIIAMAMAFVMVGVLGGIALTANFLPHTDASAEDIVSLLEATEASTAEELESPFKAVYEQVSASVVGIEVSTQMQIVNGRIENNTAFVGSGVVISDDGYVLTNHHVIEGAVNVYVISGDQEIAAEVVESDEATDVAVLKAEGLDAPAAKIGDSNALSVGDWALVVGNPLGEEYANTLTVGVISGLNREVSSRTSDGRQTTTTMIQTNAAINSGNSGGGLFNINGELVGITSMKLSNNGYLGTAAIEGIGFAIPVNTVADVASDLITYGEVQTPRLGVTVQEILSDYDEPTEDSLPRGLLVINVEADSPASEAGIQPYDVIVRADGERIESVDDLSSILQSHEIGEFIEVTVYRIEGLRSSSAVLDYSQGEEITMSVEVRVID
ncbi:MAG: trypsin-like peptidase domain-containing protein [Christensenellales bacterium]|uniref:Trypsin-like peptidase domain-containing protein n=1 Tax=Candidatus Avichristensenella intestinipullorum TaxID=2840693 RepID=A0A9D0YU99_9FIRM|nr:trypsin-like peptidase domain-containing protein [Christensenellales bacterium]HIQ62093.1 trypsin-like peptidase domain-containing protein [Candidatus Avichristensenella intestinipullorum]